MLWRSHVTTAATLQAFPLWQPCMNRVSASACVECVRVCHRTYSRILQQAVETTAVPYQALLQYNNNTTPVCCRCCRRSTTKTGAINTMFFSVFLVLTAVLSADAVYVNQIVLQAVNTSWQPHHQPQFKVVPLWQPRRTPLCAHACVFVCVPSWTQKSGRFQSTSRDSSEFKANHAVQHSSKQ